MTACETVRDRVEIASVRAIYSAVSFWMHRAQPRMLSVVFVATADTRVWK